MSALKTLYRHSLHYLTGNVCLMLLGFVSFPLFTRLFSVAEYGLINLVLKVVLIFTVLAKLGLQNSVPRFYEEHAVSSDVDSRRRYFSTFFFSAAGIGILVTLLLGFGVQWVPASLLTPLVRKLLVFAAVLVFLRGMNPILSGFLRVEERTKAYNAALIATGAARIAAVSALVFLWERTVRAFLAGSIVVEMATVLVLTWILFRRHLLVPRCFDVSFFRTALFFGLPLVSYELASLILDAGDRFLLQHYLGAEAVGYYSAAYNLSNCPAEFLMAPVNLALMPIYMRLWVTKGKEETQAFLSRSLNDFLMIAIGVACAVSLVSRDTVVVLASRKYEAAHSLLPVLVIGLMVYAVHIFFTAALLIHKKTYTMAKLVTFACVLNIGLNVVLIPRFGLQGAAVATLVSYAFLIALLVPVSFALLPLRIEFTALAKYMAAAVVTAVCVSRLNLASPTANLLLKGLLSVMVYGSILLLVDGQARALVRVFVRHHPATAKKSETLPSSGVTPAIEE